MQRYFLGGNTAVGYYGFYEREIDASYKAILIKGGAGTGKSSLMKHISRECGARGIEREEWYCSGDPDSLDGVFLPDIKLLVMDATAPHLFDPKMPIVKEKIVNLADHICEASITPYRTEIEKLVNNKKRCYTRAYEHLNICFYIKKEIDSVYGTSLDKPSVVAFAASFAEQIRERERQCVMLSKQVCREDGRDLFFNAITPNGVVAFYDHLRDKEIILVRGGPPSLATFFSQLSALLPEATRFHNPIVPEQLSGVVYKSFAVVSDVGHLKNEVSEIVDLSVYEGLYDKYLAELSESRLASEISAAVDCLSQARMNHLEIERFYISAMNFQGVNDARDAIENELFEICKQS